MRIVMFYHSVTSDWNHGNAHFLRGIATELLNRGHEVKICEPVSSWSRRNLIKEHGIEKANEYKKYYPLLNASFYNEEYPDYSSLLKDADMVIVHEWNNPNVVAEIGHLRKKYNYILLFHDTHHRAVTDQSVMAEYDFTHYDGALVYGRVLRDIYIQQKWFPKVWVWHEAADTSLFRPIDNKKSGDLVWIGNWGDDERTQEIQEFLIEPVQKLKLKACVYGVRYPEEAIRMLAKAGIRYGGWLPNYRVPEVFSQYKITVHIPRRPYTQQLPGIPTIRPFEAMACGIPLISAPWNDQENLFTPGVDFLVASDTEEMKHQIIRLLNSQDTSDRISAHGLRTILQKHTCVHRVNELEAFIPELSLHKISE